MTCPVMIYSSPKNYGKKIDPNPHHPFEMNLIFTAFLSVVECSFARLKDFRRIAILYDKPAGNVFSAHCLMAIVAYWL